jgi:hypothetical protein
MRATVRLALYLAAVASLLSPSIAGLAESPPAKPQPEAPACLKHRAEARYRNLGYDHLVHVRNTCDARVACRVSTNVNPEPIELALGPGEERELVTWRGSPAREFTARVVCRFSR